MKVEEPVMLTAAQVAERYGITSSNLRQMRFRREGPPFYKPTERVVLYRIDEFEEWLDTTRTDPSTEEEGEPAATDSQSK